MSVMNGVHNIVRQTYILKKNVEISTLSKGITHGRGFESHFTSESEARAYGITHGRGFESWSHRAMRVRPEQYHPRTWV